MPENKKNDPSFHYPKHFIPVKKASMKRISRKEFEERSLHSLTHARYLDACYSGEIICRLTTETPAFVGGNQEQAPDKNNYNKAEHFMLNGKPAIPGSTLRGMISSLAEAASNSAMRVLDNRSLSYRKSFRNHGALSAMGMIIKEEDKYFLRPLAVPTLRKTRIGNREYFLLPCEYNKFFPEPRFKIYINQRYYDHSQYQYMTNLHLLNKWDTVNYNGRQYFAIEDSLEGRELRIKKHNFAVAQWFPNNFRLLNHSAAWGSSWNSAPFP